MNLRRSRSPLTRLEHNVFQSVQNVNANGKNFEQGVSLDKTLKAQKLGRKVFMLKRNSEKSWGRGELERDSMLISFAQPDKQ